MLAGRCLCWIQSDLFVLRTDFSFLEQYLSVTVTRQSVIGAEFMCSPGKNFREKQKITPSDFDWLTVISNSYGGRQCHANVWPTLEVVGNQPASELYLCNEQLLKIRRKEATLRGVSGTQVLPLCLQHLGWRLSSFQSHLILNICLVSSSFSNPLPKITADSSRNSSLHHTISMNSVKHVEHRCSNPSFSPVPLSLQSDRSDDKDNGLSWKLYHRLQWWFKAVAVYTCTHTGLVTFTSQKSTCSCPLVPFVSHPVLFVSLFPFVCPCVSTQFHVSWAPSISWFSFRLHICVTYL